MSKPASWTAREAGLPEWVVTVLENQEAEIASLRSRLEEAEADRAVARSSLYETAAVRNDLFARLAEAERVVNCTNTLDAQGAIKHAADYRVRYPITSNTSGDLSVTEPARQEEKT